MKFKDFIVSDDIRFELGNKFSLIGTYFSRIVIESKGEPVKFPIMLKLGVLIRLKAEAHDIFPQDFQLRYNLNGKEVAMVTGQLETTKKDSTDLILPIVIHIPISGLGKLSFDLEFSRNQVHTLNINDVYSLDVISNLDSAKAVTV